MIKWLSPVELALAILIVVSGVAAGLIVGASSARGDTLPGDADRALSVEGEQTAGSVPPVAAAQADLASRLGIDQSTIVVVSADTVEWPDTALGCPEPGRAYGQVITPGYRIVLAVDGTTYEYHGAHGGTPMYCAEPNPPVGG